MPTITGEVFINNPSNTLIEEELLTKTFKVYYPNLTIRAAHVHEANITKYVQELDSGRIEIIEMLRDNGEHPLAPTKDIPRKANYDFLGWSLTPNGTLFTLYAQFEPHKYDIILLDGDGSVLRLVENQPVYNFDGQEVTMRLAAGQHPMNPTKLAYKAMEDTDENFYKAWRFTGYTLQGSYDLVDLDTYVVSRNATFVSNFELVEDVRNVVYPELFNVEAYTYDDTQKGIGIGYEDANQNIDGWKLIPKDPTSLRGKITIPTQLTVNGVTKYVVALADFSQHTTLDTPTANEVIARNLTHVFLEDNANSYLREILANCFNYCSNLQYFDFSNSIRVIENQAFRGCRLQPNPQVDATRFIIGDNVARVGRFAFNDGLQNRTTSFILYLSNTVRKLEDNSFGRLNKVNVIQENRQLEIAPDGEIGSRLYFYEPGNSNNNWFIQNSDKLFGQVTAHFAGGTNLNNNFVYIGPEGNLHLDYTDAQIYNMFGGNEYTTWLLNSQGTPWTPTNVQGGE